MYIFGLHAQDVVLHNSTECAAVRLRFLPASLPDLEKSCGNLQNLPTL